MIHQVALILYLLLQKRRVICLHFLKIAIPNRYINGSAIAAERFPMTIKIMIV